MTHMCIAPV